MDPFLPLPPRPLPPLPLVLLRLGCPFAFKVEELLLSGAPPRREFPPPVDGPDLEGIVVKRL